MSASLDTTDAVIIGSGPNGLVAGIALARRGWDVTVLERSPQAGGAIQTAELTEPGFKHDTYSAFYGLLHRSPVFAALGLGAAVDWAHFDTPVGAAVEPSRAAVIHRDVERTAAGLGAADAGAWRELVAWWSRTGERFFAATLEPAGAARPMLRLARRTKVKGGFELLRTMLMPIERYARERFSTDEARALIAAGTTHTDLSIEAAATTAGAVILAMLAQTAGMPVPVGGAGELARALVRQLDEAGGVLRTGDRVSRVVVERGRAVAVETDGGAVVRARHAVIAGTGPGALFMDMVGEGELPAGFVDGLRRYRYGTGIFKMDVALRGPVPWLAEDVRRAGVVHLTGTLDGMARAAFESGRGLLPARPLLICGQQTVADPSRAPEGCHTLWIETQVPGIPRGDGDSDAELAGWSDDARDGFAERVLDRVEQFAPGTRALIAGVAVRTPRDLERENPNLVGGDLGGGSQALDQQLVFRPVPGWFRYRTPVKGLYLCSASVHPGAGVHGMGGWNCARRVLRDSIRPRGVMKTASSARRSPTRPR
ncbi:MAG TPA: NAD(P)/FAD-dependent oxidoreductase [Actinomycetota bacterium]